MLAQAKVLIVLDRFMYKAKKVNKSYKAIQKTDDYKKFYDMFEQGIKDQAKWISDNTEKLFASAGIADDIQPLTLDQQQKLRGLVERDMPTLSDYVTEHKIFMSLKTFFEWSAKLQYKRWGYIVKSDKVQFELSNPQYIANLKDRANYLLNKSSLDQTTTDQVIDMYSEGRLDGLTNAEVADMIETEFDDISSSRADMIARTESANAVGEANNATAVENGAQTHSWVAAGNNPDDECLANEDDGEIPIDQEFSSGDLYEPAHPNCECYTEAGEIDLSTIDVWGGE
jgi:uncharacterized protein with gpF-like domain